MFLEKSEVIFPFSKIEHLQWWHIYDLLRRYCDRNPLSVF